MFDSIFFLLIFLASVFPILEDRIDFISAGNGERRLRRTHLLSDSPRLLLSQHLLLAFSLIFHNFLLTSSSLSLDFQLIFS